MAKKNKKETFDSEIGNNERTDEKMSENENNNNENSSDNNGDTSSQPAAKKRGRVAGVAATNRIFAVVAGTNGIERVPFVSKQALSAWAKENLAGGEESLANDTKYMTSGEMVEIVWGHVIRASVKQVSKLVF